MLKFHDHGLNTSLSSEIPHNIVCFSGTLHSFTESIQVPWPSEKEGLANVCNALNLPLPKQSIIVLKRSCTKIQEEILGSKKCKALTLIFPDLSTKALLEFLDSTAPVTCDEILIALEKEK